MDPQELFLSNLDAIDRAIGYVCHRNHLSPQDAEEFNSEVKTKLIEANYAVLRKFEGRSSFSTYMTTVIQRLYFQWRVQMWGKWRPSAEARRLGEKAITLERLLTRDGFTYREALETAGIDRETIADLLDRSDHELSFFGGGKSGARHSHNADGESGKGESRVTR